MFAVVGQQLIFIFAEAGPGPLHGIYSGINGVWFRPNFYTFSCRKAAQRNIFNGTPFRGMVKAPVVNNLPIPRIDSVVCIAFPLTNKMGTNFDSAFCADQRRRSCQAINKWSFHGEPHLSLVMLRGRPKIAIWVVDIRLQRMPLNEMAIASPTLTADSVIQPTSTNRGLRRNMMFSTNDLNHPSTQSSQPRCDVGMVGAESLPW